MALIGKNVTLRITSSHLKIFQPLDIALSYIQLLYSMEKCEYTPLIVLDIGETDTAIKFKLLLFTIHCVILHFQLHTCMLDHCMTSLQVQPARGSSAPQWKSGVIKRALDSGPKLKLMTITQSLSTREGTYQLKYLQRGSTKRKKVPTYVATGVVNNQLDKTHNCHLSAFYPSSS